MGTLTGTYTLPTGTPESGAITLRLTGRVVNATGPQIYTEGPISADLDENGAFTVDLVAVDDTGFDGLVTDLAYELVEHLSSRGDAGPRYIRPLGAGPWAVGGVGLVRRATRTRPPNPSPDPPERRGTAGRPRPRRPHRPRGPAGRPRRQRWHSRVPVQLGQQQRRPATPAPATSASSRPAGRTGTIAISATDADGTPQNWGLLLVGDGVTVTDDPDTPPVSGFARYWRVRDVEVLGGGTWYRVAGPAHRHQRHHPTTPRRDTAAGRRRPRRTQRAGTDHQNPGDRPPVHRRDRDGRYRVAEYSGTTNGWSATWMGYAPRGRTSVTLDVEASNGTAATNQYACAGFTGFIPSHILTLASCQ